MNRNQRIFYGNPWYRGYMPRSYIPPHCIASFGCSVYLIAFGIFFIFGGMIATIVSKSIAESDRRFYENPKFNDPFFKDSRERSKANSISTTNTMQAVGITFISVGAIFIIAAITICCFAKKYMKKHEKKPQNIPVSLNEGLAQPAGYYPPPPPGSYPQQSVPPDSYPQYPMPASSAYPPQYPPGSYPQQPVTTPTSYPQQSAPQDSYPYPPTTQPATFDSQMPNTANPPPVGFKEG